MKVILKENVKSLGNVGEIHNVSPGFARNFLIRNNLATLADDSNTKALNDQKKALAKRINEEKSAAETIGKRLNGMVVEIEKKVGGSGRLFGTVTTADIKRALEDRDVNIEKRTIVIDSPIKQLGKFEVKAKLFEGVEVKFNVQVNKDAKQVVEDAKNAKLKKAAKEKAEADAIQAKKEEAEAAAAEAEGTSETAEEQADS